MGLCAFAITFATGCTQAKPITWRCLMTMPTTCRWREAPVPSSSLCKSAGRAWKVPIDSPELSGSTSREDAGSGLPVEGDAEPPEPSAFRRKSSVSCCVACALRVRPPREVDSISVAGGSLGSSLDLGPRLCLRPRGCFWKFTSLQFKSHFSRHRTDGSE